MTLSGTNSAGTTNATLTITATGIPVWSVQTVAKATPGTGNSLSPSFPTNTAAGDLIHMAFDSDTNATHLP